MMPSHNEALTHRRRKLLLILSVAFFLSGVCLSASPLNQAWMLSVNHLVSNIDPMWSFLTQFGEGGAALLLLLTLTQRSPTGTALSVKCFLLGSLLSPLLKTWFSHPRPLGVLGPELIHTIGVPAAASNAMPSGHSMTVVAAVTLLFWCLPAGRPFKWLGAFMVAFAILVALSRVMVGAHWPSDVIAGAGVGIFVVWLANAWEHRQPFEVMLQTRRGQACLLMTETGLVLYLFLASTHNNAEQLAFDLIATVGIAGALSRWRHLRQQSNP